MPVVTFFVIIFPLKTLEKKLLFWCTPLRCTPSSPVWILLCRCAEFCMLTPYVRLFPLLAKYFLPQPKNMDEEFLCDCCRSESVCFIRRCLCSEPEVCAGCSLPFAWWQPRYWRFSPVLPKQNERGKLKVHVSFLTLRKSELNQI